jgi:hypothetical protein
VTEDVPSFADLVEVTQRSAIHLEMRDTYTPNQPRFLAWKAGVREDPMDRAGWLPFHEIVERATARGVRFRRARIVSEPVTDYIRFEYDVTPSNIAVGEEVRWLPRPRASSVALPGNDFWVFDDRLIRFGHFAGDGEFLYHEMVDDPATVKLCVSAFDAVWERATPHQNYRPT